MYRAVFGICGWCSLTSYCDQTTLRDTEILCTLSSRCGL